MDFMSEAAARNWCEKASEPYQISIEDFAKRVKAYIGQKGNNHHVVFLVDEIGQYIGEDSKLMLNLQTVTEELGKECMGKAWVIVTSQQDIDSVTKVKGNDFSKIQGRFDTRLSLSSANVDEVIKKRILEKNDTSAQTLRLLYGQKTTIIKNLITFNDGVEKKLYADENDFALVYPFIPYQFNLLASVLTSIRTHGASGKHLSEGERSMLAMFKESAVDYKDCEMGAIIPFYAFYDALENFLDHSHRGVIIRAYDNDVINPEHKDKVFAVDVLKVLFMIKYVDKVVVANVDNITSLKVLEYLLTKFRDAKEYGSTLLVEKMDYDSFISEWIQAEEKIYSNVVLIGWYKEIENEVLSLAKQASILASEYEVVVTNPPYMGSSMMNTNLNEYLKKNYPLSKGDLFAVFIEVANRLVKRNYLSSLITMQSWMFLSSYEKLREELVGTDLVTMLHLGARAFEEISGDVVQTAAFVLRKSHVNGNVSICDRLIDIDNASEKEKVFLTGEKRCFSLKENFERIPAKPYAYWISEDVLKSFKGRNLGELAEIVSGMTTGNNDLYLREWNEVDINSIAFGYSNVDDIDLSLTKWIPYHKGGEQRKWYGNNEYVVNWSQSGNFNRAKTTMTYLYLKPCVTWSDISGNTFAGRFCNGGFMFDVKGSCGFGNEDDLKYLMAIFNSKIMPTYIEALNPTTTTQVGDLKRIPLKPIDATIKEMLFPLVEDNIRISKEEWDNYEQSWDFMTHPLIKYKKSSGLIIEAMNELKNSISLLMQTMRDNEEKINSIIIAEYGLQNEISPDVSIENVSLRQIDERKEICSLLSYAVGCMFGRYSVDKQGIAYAGGEWKTDNYSNFIPDEDNVVLITDEEYFADDIVGKFCSWLEVVFGKEALEANIQYIAETLENKAETSRAVIRNFFINEFEEFHIKGFEKRPIYWLFDSGKQNGFKALVYMHRYNADTIGNLRVDYLHRMERIYESEINRMQDTIDNSSNAREVTAATKRKEKLQKQLKECQEYDEKIGHLALSRIDIDLDDGVKVNYEKVQTANDGKKYQVLAKI